MTEDSLGGLLSRIGFQALAGLSVSGFSEFAQGFLGVSGSQSSSALGEVSACRSPSPRTAACSLRARLGGGACSDPKPLKFRV